MTIPQEQSQAMLEAAKPLIQWLNKNCHPHCKVIVENNSIELVEGLASNKTNEFIKD